MSWFYRIASPEYYENMVFSALRKHNLLDAVDALKRHGPHGIQLWTKFKDEFKENAKLLSDWITNLTAPSRPHYVGTDEIDEWASRQRGMRNPGRTGVPKANFDIEQPTGGAGFRSVYHFKDDPPYKRKK